MLLRNNMGFNSLSRQITNVTNELHMNQIDVLKKMDTLNSTLIHYLSDEHNTTGLFQKQFDDEKNHSRLILFT